MRVDLTGLIETGNQAVALAIVLAGKIQITAQYIKSDLTMSRYFFHWAEE